MKMINKGILPLSVSGGAALVSIIVGMISGVTPGTLLVRGLLSAVAAAAFVLLSSWLVNTFLPELSSLETRTGAGPESAAGPGSRVNIVMSDDSDDSSDSDSDLPGDGPSYRSTGSGDGDDIEIAESAGSVHNNKQNDFDTDNLDSEGLDTLPNLDSLEINMGGGSSSSGYGGDDGLVSEETVSSVKVSDKQSSQHGDPEEIAKAVKTVLARDKQR